MHWCLAVLSIGLAQAAAPRFDTPVLTNGTLQLRLVGDPGETYRLEVSTNLVTWGELATGLAPNGVLSVDHAVPATQPSLYYRAVLVPRTPVFPTVTATADTNYVTAALISPELGGYVELQSPEGVLFKFDLPPQAVLQPVVVQMTLLTNLVGVPAAEGYLAAVRLEPAGLVLASPTFLDVRYPTNLPSSRVASYAFENDGTELHLTPDLVGTNRVRILVGQLGSFGSGLFTIPELERMAANQPPARARPLSPQASMEECYPEEEEEALRLREELERAIRPLQQNVAKELSLERQRQLLGVEEPENPSITGILQPAFTAFEQVVKSKAPNAARKCAVGRELLSWLLGFERQRILLGISTEPDPEISALMCALFARCQEQALECCRTRGPDTRLVVFLLGLERQSQLLGAGDAGCGTPLDLPNLLEACAPPWFGYVRIQENLRKSVDNRTDSSARSETQVRSFELEATVNTVNIDVSDPVPELGLPGFTNMTFSLSGLAKGAGFVRSFVEDGKDPCAGGGSGARSRSGVGLHDGGIEYTRTVGVFHNTLSNVVQFELSVTLSDESAGPSLVPTRLFSVVDSLETPWKGQSVRTDKVSIDGDCTVTNTVDRAATKEMYVGELLDLAGHQFTHSTNEIAYTLQTTNVDGARRTVEILLRRRL